MAPAVRAALLFSIAVSLHGTAASDPEEEPSPFEVSIDSVAALFPASQKQILDMGKHSLVDSEALLMSLLAVVPGNDGDRFSAPAVRFALHKHFVRQYGWHLKGLEPAGAAWNSSSPLQADIFRRLPDGVASLFESRFKDGGLLGREVAVLAATLDLLVHMEAGFRMHGVLDMLNMPPHQLLTEDETSKVRDWYMTSFMLGKSPLTTKRIDLKDSVAEIPDIFPAWDSIVGMVDGLFSKQPQTARNANLFSAVEEIGHRFGPWQNALCSRLKKSLLQLHDDGSGRVELRDFYYAGLHGRWEFTESVDFLSNMGALDTSIPTSPRVIIPNYVGAPSNCLATAETHDVCCVSECEPVLAQLEREIGAPTALPERILEVVAGIPSSTMPAGRQLPDLLVSRLKDVADAHDGVVPLTGRLFAQWLHHAYPRECPYPHLAGTTAPVNVDIWEAAHHKSSHEKFSVMKRLAGQHARSDGPVMNAPWEQQEELLVEVHHSEPVGAACIHMFVACAAAGVAALGICRSAVRSARGSSAAAAKSCEQEHGLAV